MKKIAFCLENCINNNCFDLSNLEINRDNCSYSLFLLKKIFKKYNFNQHVILIQLMSLNILYIVKFPKNYQEKKILKYHIYYYLKVN